MALTTLSFPNDINVSAQVGDLAWYVPTNLQGVQGNQYQTNDIDNIVLIGPITNINDNILTIDQPAGQTPPTAFDIIMFSINFLSFPVLNNLSISSVSYILNTKPII